MPDIMEFIVRPKRFIALLGFATLAACAESPAPPSEPASLAIVGAQLIDGTGGDRYTADVGITGDRIVSIGDLTDAEAARRIDVSGRVVAPGFIDVHNFRARAFRRVVERALGPGRRFKPHGLRHTFASAVHIPEVVLGKRIPLLGC